MHYNMVLFLRQFLLLLSCLCLVQAGEDSVLLWSSTGGGWRAMFADIGYANIFQQAGLFDHNSTRFSGVVSDEKVYICNIGMFVI